MLVPPGLEDTPGVEPDGRLVDVESVGNHSELVNPHCESEHADKPECDGENDALSAVTLSRCRRRCVAWSWRSAGEGIHD
jgi:hypothetical protein